MLTPRNALLFNWKGFQRAFAFSGSRRFFLFDKLAPETSGEANGDETVFVRARVVLCGSTDSKTSHVSFYFFA